MKDFLKENGIEFFGIIPLERCKILKEYLLLKNGFDKSHNAITMLLPYRTECLPKNLSVYASVPDYHGFVEELSKRLDQYTKAKYPQGKFKLFSDHSPIDEVHATCISGLGFIGDNGLLINKEYSSFVFLAECITDLSPEELGMEFSLDNGILQCLHCGACAEACPTGCIKKADHVDNFNPKTFCLSAITQKKGDLSEDELSLMLQNNTVWGCDICQNVCPYTKGAKFSPIDYFKRGIITNLTSDTINNMSDEEFMSRPFSWRGRGVILRNLKHYEERK